MRALHAHQQARLDELEALVGLLASKGCDDSTRRAAAEMIRDFDVNQLKLDHEALETAYAPLREQLEAVAAGTSGRLDVEQVGRYAWLCRRHMAAEAALPTP